MTKHVKVKTTSGEAKEIPLGMIRYMKIVDGESRDGPQKAKIVMAGDFTPVMTEQSVADLRSSELPLVYVGGGVYVPRAHIRLVEPLSDRDRQGLADAKKIDTSKFKTRIVLSGELTPVWGIKSIEQLNERGMRFVPLGNGSHVHRDNIRKIVELDDPARARIADKLGIDASAFRMQVVLEGDDKPKLSRMSIIELKAKGLDLVPIQHGEYAVRGNVKYFRSFLEEEQEDLARKYPDADAARFATKIVLASEDAMLSTSKPESLQAAFAAVNIGYDRYVPAANIVPERVTAFSKDDKKGLADAGYAMERNWRSSIGLINGRILSPATAEQIRQRRDVALEKAEAAGSPQIAAE
ncbi:hypothetical protein [Hyphomicrobium sp.]|uniref:hypothetical protein n=1 Tax=Hyphomicrobium sp. TaxID=82 RepID=UPI002FE09858